MKLILKILLMGVAALGISHLLPEIKFEDTKSAFIFVIILTILNAIVRPVLIVLTIPITIITLGLFLLVINAFIILMADWLMDGFAVSGWLWALIFSLLLSVANSIIENLLSDKK